MLLLILIWNVRQHQHGRDFRQQPVRCLHSSKCFVVNVLTELVKQYVSQHEAWLLHKAAASLLQEKPPLSSIVPLSDVRHASSGLLAQ